MIWLYCALLLGGTECDRVVEVKVLSDTEGEGIDVGLFAGGEDDEKVMCVCVRESDVV